VIDELHAHPAPDTYLDYLRLKLREAAAALPRTYKNLRFPMTANTDFGALLIS